MLTPVYEVDDYSPDKIDGERFSFTLAEELRWRIDRPDIPRSSLLPAEKVVLDYCRYSCDVRNGFRMLIDYSRGPETFARGMSALRAIGAIEHFNLMEKAKSMMESGGLAFPEPLPELWWDSDEGYDDFPPEVESELDSLDSPLWKLKEDGYLLLLRFVQAHKQELICRRCPPDNLEQI